MPIRVQLSPFLRNYVPNYDNDTGIILDDANRLSVQQIISKLDIPQEEVITIMVNVYPEKPKNIVKDGDVVTLSKIIGGG